MPDYWYELDAEDTKSENELSNSDEKKDSVKDAEKHDRWSDDGSITIIIQAITITIFLFR